jgi:hypothetical protein
MIFHSKMCLKIDFPEMLNLGSLSNLKSILICIRLNFQLRDFYKTL